MARALEEIIKELDAVYTPQKDIYSKQINALPGQQQAEMSGLEASKNDSFEQITTGANRRGVAFGGIPLAEQAKYLGSSYLPAVANLKNRFAGIQSELALKLAELGAAQRRDAYSLYESELARDAAARASSGGGGGFGGFNFNPIPTAPTTPAKADPNAQIKKTAYSQVNDMLSRSGSRSFYEELVAISKSAGYGNTLDQAKLELLQQSQPGLFVNGKVNMNRINQLISNFTGDYYSGGGGGGGGGGGW